MVLEIENPDAVSKVLTPQTVLSAKQLQEALQIKHAKFYVSLRDGELPPPSFRIGSKITRWIWCDVEAFLRAKTASKQAESQVQI
jgi:predicted DNA-binding transcriptional regulator AlpA